MNLSVERIPTRAPKSEVTKTIAAIVHGETFVASIPRDSEYALGKIPINFQVELNREESGHNENNGTGTVTFPDSHIAHAFLIYSYREKVRIKYEQSRGKLFFKKSEDKPPPWLVQTLTLTPYISPDVKAERESMIESLSDRMRVIEVQVGMRLNATLSVGHEAVAPFAYQLRVVLYDSSSLDKFKEYMAIMDVSPLLMDLRGRGSIETEKRGFVSRLKSVDFKKELAALPFAVSFQVEALVRSNRLNADQIYQLFPQLHQLSNIHRNTGFVEQLLERYNRDLRLDPTQKKDPIKHFNVLRQKFKASPRRSLESNLFNCYHVTCTPSRLLPEGPHPTGFNRILRKYRNYTDHFIRVEFRTEDGGWYRSSFEVDGSYLVDERVGGILKGGIEIAGRHYERLAYSSSSLKVHSDWFIYPFDYIDNTGKTIRVDAQYIRDSIIPDIESNSSLFRKPSKYAARIALAFSTSESSDSIRIARHQWVGDCPDVDPPARMMIKRDQYGDIVLGEDGKPQMEPHVPPPFTDGVGAISKRLADQICASTGRYEGKLKPSAFMLRFLGFKGMVAVDPELDKDPSGIELRLRPSMHKFASLEDDPTRKSEVAIDHTDKTDCRPLIMLLEHLSVDLEVLVELQNAAVADAKTIDANISQFSRFMSTHGLGGPFRFPKLLDDIEALGGLSLEEIDTPLLKNLRQTAFNSIMAEIRYDARIPVPDSYMLVGVVDEGHLYQEKYRNVFTLSPNQIYACVQNADDLEPKWIEGTCAITRHPIVHEGDLQVVYAIGKPPPGMFCAFGHMVNVVVFSATGQRSLPSCLAGGDLDGDKYAIITYEGLVPMTFRPPAEPDNTMKDHEFPDSEPDRKVKAEDLCKFYVQYIRSDVLKSYGDERCKSIATLCSQAVDYPKKGIPVDLDEHDDLLRRPLKATPNWNRNESSDSSTTIYYKSTRYLGVLYESKHFDNIGEPVDDCNSSLAPVNTPPFADKLSQVLGRAIEEVLGPGTACYQMPSAKIQEAFRRYAEELDCIRYTHTLSSRPEHRLSEVEVIAGTIVARHNVKKLRKERISRMMDHTSCAVRNVRFELMGAQEEKSFESLQRGWEAWGFSQTCEKEGAGSFGLIALRVVFECLDDLRKAVYGNGNRRSM
ncbi:RdRP-domain-containing protein [Coprinopsis marcescibilis]|uniref:RNA-dependent RNA polymerase n=1 Tax=Coprinopsis marcescibilis TaxID=230819 RepID=A0A5C3L7G7_COPMA|nr:RdRP-domain-containing protein [Coprinopsis marcescibilis]